MLHSQLPGLYILNQEDKGRSVFCSEKISKGSTIEICPVIIINTAETKIIHQTKLHDYYFLWEIEKMNSALALGYGSLYNHASDPNADFDCLLDSNEIKFSAIRDINSGEEITINYQSLKLKETDKLWFKEL